MVAKEKIRQIIRENISSIVKDKEEEIFNYSNIIRPAWNKIVHSAQEFQNIYFDLENDDSTGQKRIFYVKKNLRKDQPIKYQINAELCMAGGDWENPVMYFRVELTHDYSLKNSKYNNNPKYIWDLERDYNGLYNCFVLIPPVEAGNKLIKTEDKKGWRAYQNEDISPDDKKIADIEEKDQKKAWGWLKDLLEKAIDKRHEMLD